MTKTFFAAALAVAALAGAAAAQPYRGGSATLYELPNYQGRSVTITQSTPDLGKWRFNDRAQSARFEGRWLVCEHDDFKGRCQEVRGDVPNLHTYGLMAQVSSLEPAGGGRPGGPGPGPGPGPGFPGGGARGIDGATSVFFPRPTVRGFDVAAGDRGANAFCRSQGLGRAVFFDSSARAERAIGPDGEPVGRSDVLRDLLCRKY
ncbi:MAG: beta/gamma crystallin family protein [Phenylobacterium sp.]|uniref:beta/gamma crystallin-related protein n=1 Tax=Phenylobacterium sp. TaxID=1871053 RepID=UPI001A3C4907|nr:beta/gamma crystallin-related protein [Phenylobacterium sp.]MBL8553848.1 beta/gamma crystallin family protein [Phenylobacterium sp.]